MPVSLESRLPKVAREIGPKVDRALALSAELIAGKAKERVPVESGTLKNAIHVDAEEGVGYSVVAGDSKAFYGHMVEFGTSHSAAEPFLIPALEESKGEALKLITAALRGL